MHHDFRPLPSGCIYVADDIAAPESDTDHVAGIYREKMDKRKKAPHREAKAKSSKTTTPLAQSIIKGKPDIRGSSEKENATQHKIDNLD
jgi:hypothetical protein